MRSRVELVNYHALPEHIALSLVGIYNGLRMIVQSGARFDNYEIERRIAGGGMGEVWLARDLRLDRKVAIKLVSPRLTEDSARVAGLRQEARAASALNHPNVCTIYGLGDTDDGGLFIAMEYIDGTTLRDRLDARRLSTLEAIELGAQIATGLTAAHTAGIIHRDIKPENVMIRADGLLKLLDFGLAKLDVRTWSVADQTTKTALGMDSFVGGTMAYMSPEQVRGEMLDARTDIFSFGAVLYEMLTGHQPFAAHSPALVHDNILNVTPTPPIRLNPAIPPRLDDVVMKALEKDRGLRYQTASELRTDLVRLKRDTEAPLSLARAARSSDGTASTRRISRRAVWITGLAVLAAIAVVSWRSVRERIFPSELQEIQLTTNSSENPVNAAAISPDGKYLAYADRAGIHLQLIDSRETHTVVAPEIRDIHNIYWFPDGSKLIVSGVETPGERVAIWSVSILGADRRKLRNDGLQASISSDGSQIAFLDSARTQVWVMGPNGEEPRVAVTAGPGDTFYSPGFSGGRLWYGRVRLVADKTAGVRSEISAESLRDGDINVALSDPGLRGVVLLPDGRLLYSIVAQRQLNQGGSSLWIARLDEATGLISRQRRVHDWAGTVSLWQFTASADGKRVVCLKRSIQKDVYVADLPSHGKPTNPRRVTLDDSIDVGANWTPDGKALLFFSDRNGSFDIFKQSLDAPTAEPIVSGPDDELGPTAVSSDGAWFYYLVRRPRSRTQTPAVDAAVMRTAAAGGPRETLADDSKFHSVLCAKAPSTTCIFIERDGTELSIYTVNPDNVRARKIATTDIIGAQAPSAISPDGSKVAVQMPAARRIRVLFLNGDAPLDIPLPDRPLDGDAFYWSADGAGVYVSSAGPGGTDLLHVDLNGGVNIVWQQSVREWMSGIPSPDGRHIALTQSSAISNVWMLKDFR